MLVCQAFKSFAQNTSLTGFNRLLSPARLITLVWSLIIIGVAICSAYHLKQLIYSYYEYKVNTAFTVKQDMFEFPDVTICPTAQASETRRSAKENERYLKIEKFTKKFWTAFWYHLVNIKSKEGREKIGQLGVEDVHDKFLLEEYNFTGSQSGEFLTLDHTINVHERFWYTHYLTPMARQIQDVLISCTFGQEPCGLDNFQQYDDPYHFNCFTFQPKNRSVLDLNSTSGVPKSLKLTLHRENGTRVATTTYDFMSHAIGFYVNTHAANTLPYSGQKILAEIGYKTSIFIDMESEKNINLPGRVCRQNGRPINLSSSRVNYNKSATTEIVNNNDCDQHDITYHECPISKIEKANFEAYVSTKQRNFTYNSVACKIAAHQYKLHHACKCVNPQTLVPTELLSVNTKTCGDFPIEEINIESLISKRTIDKLRNVTKVDTNFKWKNATMTDFVEFVFRERELDHEIDCLHNNTKMDESIKNGCPDDCETKNYSPLTINRVKFPFTAEDARDYIKYRLDEAIVNAQQAKKDISVLETLKRSLQNNFNNLTYYRNSFQQIEIIPISKDLNLLEETRATTQMELLSSIGGMFGLWSGVCVITVFEIAGLFGSLFTGLMLHILRKRKKPEET